MARKRYRGEEIVAKLRQAEVLPPQGMVVTDAIRQIDVSEVKYFRWRKEYGGMAANELKRMHHERWMAVQRQTSSVLGNATSDSRY